MTDQSWDKAILPRRGLFDIPLRELWRYRDLMWMLATRDITATYKQTILGPAWFILQPLLTTFAFSFLFGRMAGLGTDHVPHFLFYVSGLMVWAFFAECINRTSQTFIRNGQIFGKVYFPRLAVPAATVLTSMVTFLVNFGVFLAGFAFYLWKQKYAYDPAHPFVLEPNWRMLLLPALLLQAGALGIGVGLIVCSFATKFKDLALGIGFIVQIWMYASMIVFPFSRIAEESRWIFHLNPMVPIIEAVRLGFVGRGVVSLDTLATSACVCAAVLAVGLVMFNRAEQRAMDTV